MFLKLKRDTNASLLEVLFLLPHNFKIIFASQGQIACFQVDCTLLFCNNCPTLQYIPYFVTLYVSVFNTKKLPDFVITLTTLCRSRISSSFLINLQINELSQNMALEATTGWNKPEQHGATWSDQETTPNIVFQQRFYCEKNSKTDM